MSKLLISLLFILSLIEGNWAMADAIVVTGTPGRSGFQADSDGGIYYVSTISRNTLQLLHIDIDSQVCSVAFSDWGIDGDFTIGDGQICFRHVIYQPPFVSYIGPHAYYTSSLFSNNASDWTRRTSLSSPMDRSRSRCAFVDNKLYIIQEENGNSSLYRVEGETLLHLRTYKDSHCVIYDNVFLVIDASCEEYSQFYHIFLPRENQDVMIPKTINDAAQPEIVAIEQKVYIGTNNRVVEYNIGSHQSTILIKSGITERPLLCYSNNHLYIYMYNEHLLYEYDTHYSKEVSTYFVPVFFPAYCPIVFSAECLLLADDRTQYIYVFNVNNNQSAILPMK